VRHDPAVVGEDAQIRAERRDRRDRLGVPDPGWLEERDPELSGSPRDRRRGELALPAGRAVGSADDRDDDDLRRGEQRLEDREGERAAAEEDEPGGPG